MKLVAALRNSRQRALVFLANRAGTTAIEYAMIAALISVAILGAVNALGGDLQTTFYNKLAALFP